MSNRWKVLAADGGGGARLPLGPLGDTLPARFSARAAGDEGITVEVAGHWDGKSRLAVTRVALSRTGDAPLSPRDLTRVQLAQVIHVCGRALTEPGHGWAIGRRTDRELSDEELRYVAAVYWFHFVSWGSPRDAIMRVWGIPRTTANRWIRRAGDLHSMPIREGGSDG